MSQRIWDPVDRCYLDVEVVPIERVMDHSGFVMKPGSTTTGAEIVNAKDTAGLSEIRKVYREKTHGTRSQCLCGAPKQTSKPACARCVKVQAELNAGGNGRELPRTNRCKCGARKFSGRPLCWRCRDRQEGYAKRATHAREKWWQAARRRRQEKQQQAA
jgi:hypothetical protein